jgi:hypothetical protein
MCLILHAGSGTWLGDWRLENSMAPDARMSSIHAWSELRDPNAARQGPRHTGNGAEEAQGKEHTGQTAPPFRSRGPPRSKATMIT